MASEVDKEIMKVKKALARHNEKKNENAKKNKISSKLEYAWQVEI